MPTDTQTPTVTLVQATTPWTQSMDAPGVVYDLFPTTVKTPDAYYEKVRIILTNGSPSGSLPKLYVFLDGPQGPGVVIEAVYDPSRIYGDTVNGLDVYAALDPDHPTIASVVELRPRVAGRCPTRCGRCSNASGRPASGRSGDATADGETA